MNKNIYILQKDLHHVRSGVEFMQENDNPDYYNSNGCKFHDRIHKDRVENNPEWFLPKEEKIKVTSMYDLNNIYQKQHVRVVFEVNHPIPEEKYEAVKKAIEDCLNGVPSIDSLMAESNRNTVQYIADNSPQKLFTEQQVLQKEMDAFNAARKYATKNLEFGKVISEYYEVVEKYFIYNNFSSYKNSQ